MVTHDWMEYLTWRVNTEGYKMKNSYCKIKSSKGLNLTCSHCSSPRPKAEKRASMRTMARQSIRRQKKNGFSLLCILIAVAILSILGGVLTSSFGNNLVASKKITELGSTEDIRRYIRIGMDCPRTLAGLPNPCPAGTSIAIEKRSGATPLIQTPNNYGYSVIGKTACKLIDV